MRPLSRWPPRGWHPPLQWALGKWHSVPLPVKRVALGGHLILSLGASSVRCENNRTSSTGLPVTIG